ncbi:MAG: hypothetical protein HZB16_12770 [Armatimonadetes bacterium]|nr:hypothetical protein [Armatimonadota bacterium]
MAREPEGQLYFVHQGVREFRAGATLEVVGREGKLVRAEVKEPLTLPIGVANEPLYDEDGGRRVHRYKKRDVVVGPDVEKFAEHITLVELQPGDVISSSINRGVTMYLEGLRRHEPEKALLVEAELSSKLRVCGRDGIVSYAEAEVENHNRDFEEQAITLGERTGLIQGSWVDASDRVYDEMLKAIVAYDPNNPVFMMSDSGARGNRRQLTQLAGMRGLMNDPSGRIIEDLAIKSNFREGLTVHEYFISTHGARKGLADTALRTADAGYLTRRMVDVAQDVIVREIDCGTSNGVYVESIWEQSRRCPTCGALERHLGRYGLHAAEFVEKLAVALGLDPDNDVRRDAETELRYAYAIKPKKASDLHKYERIEEGTKIHDLVADRTYRFDVIHDPEGSWLSVKPLPQDEPTEPLDERIAGRNTIEPIYHPTTGEMLLGANEEVGDELAKRLAAGLLFEQVLIRTASTCDSRRGICAKCYGRDMATKRDVEVGEAVGIIAAQSIGEPGTQLTMRTFHTGGVATGPQLTGVVNVKRRKMEAMRQLLDDMQSGKLSEDELGSGERERNRAIQEMLKVLEDACGGLLRVVELFEARRPKGEAITTDVDGIVEDVTTGGLRKVVIRSRQSLSADPMVFKGAQSADTVTDGRRTLIKEGKPITRKDLQTLEEHGHKDILIRKEYLVPSRGSLEVRKGDEVQSGDRLTPGPLDPGEVLEFRGVKGVVGYIIQEIQKVYRSQGVSINDKHIEIVVRQMLRKREIVTGGDTDLLPGQKVDRAAFDEQNERVMSQGGRPAVARFVMLGITEASLATESFLSAASFQKTTRVLTEAAVQGKEDRLMGLKENVIIGRLIPAGTGMPAYQDTNFDFDNVTREDLLTSISQPTEEEREEEADLEAEMRFMGELARDGELSFVLEDGEELLSGASLDGDEDDEDEDEDLGFGASATVAEDEEEA